jgi:DNA-binding NarL/FixJ family response regulator
MLVRLDLGTPATGRYWGYGGLTDQESEILQLIAAGLTNKHIGAQHFWSETTVKRKMREIYRTLGVKNRVHAVDEASRLGLI